MAQTIRQENLFAAENWQSVYQSFKNADFKAYDFDTLRTAMIEYIRTNYPEDFNDWIQSSEFVALIDLVAFLGQNLGFRIDLNSRENFIDTAERKENVLRLARFLSYNPKRNVSAQGLLKIKSIKTTENVLDSTGSNLANVPLQWAGVNDPDSFEKFITVLNSVFGTNHPFGTPVKAGTVGGVTSQLYSLNTIPDQQVAVSYSASVASKTSNFEICNPTFADLGYYEEQTPDPFSQWNLLYRNDGAGNTSANTGFFVVFKQGQMNKNDYQLNDYIENRVIDIDIEMINEQDVYVQAINEDGSVVNNWKNVPNLVGNNIIYNSFASGDRKICSVITRDNDKISVKFGDGYFSQVPRGIIRVWTRSSNGETYTIRPEDMKNITWDFAYYDKVGKRQFLTLTADLEYDVTNSVGSEDIESVRVNAPNSYYSQDRMVTGNDYSVYPLTTSNNILKIKATNRIHSGFSRYTNITDPTGTNQSLDIFTDDAYIYKDEYYTTNYYTVNNNLYLKNLIVDNLAGILREAEVVNMFYSQSPALNYNQSPSPTTGLPTNVKWNRVTLGSGKSTGYFTGFEVSQNFASIIKIGLATVGQNRQIVQGALLEFEDPDTQVRQWVAVTNIYGTGQGVQDLNSNNTGRKEDGTGVVVLSKNIKTNSKIIRYIPRFKQVFGTTEYNLIKELLETKLPFAIRYDYITQTYRIVSQNNIGNSLFYNTTFAGDVSEQNKDNSWWIRVNYENDQYVVYHKSIRYISGSVNKVRFFNENFKKAINSETTKIEQDSFYYLPSNLSADGTKVFGKKAEFKSDKYFIAEDSFTDNTKLVVSLSDANSDFLPDDPYIFEGLVGSNIVKSDYVTVNGIKFRQIFDSSYEDTTTSITHKGRTDLYMQWHHIAESNQRIDPSSINIIDLFVLTSDYDLKFRRWLKATGKIEDMPLPPTPQELYQNFAALEEVKTSSDTIVYRPSKYKILFGNYADKELKGKFKVIKLAGTSLSDSEIKSRTLTAIDEFFSIVNWTFGETFYFTELAAYIHTKLAGSISSVVLVPQGTSTTFGDLFQVTSGANELFVSGATIKDIDIITQLTDTNLKQQKLIKA